MRPNAIVRSGHGTFVWWSDDRLPATVEHLIIQIRNTAVGATLPNSTNPMQLSGTVAGSLPWPSQQQHHLSNVVPIVWENIASALQVFAADRTDVDADTIELRVPANVNGIWLAGIQRMQMRIIVPILREADVQKVLALNYTHMEWTAVSLFNCVAVYITCDVVGRVGS